MKIHPPEQYGDNLTTSAASDKTVQDPNQTADKNGQNPDPTHAADKNARNLPSAAAGRYFRCFAARRTKILHGKIDERVLSFFTLLLMGGFWLSGWGKPLMLFPCFFIIFYERKSELLCYMATAALMWTMLNLILLAGTELFENIYVAKLLEHIKTLPPTLLAKTNRLSYNIQADIVAAQTKRISALLGNLAGLGFAGQAVAAIWRKQLKLPLVDDLTLRLLACFKTN